MTHANRRKRFLYLFYFILLLVVFFVIYQFLNYWFGNFYKAPLEQYEKWYPKFYFLIFIVVKLLPFFLFAAIVFLFRKLFINVFLLVKNAVGGIILSLESFLSKKKSSSKDESGQRVFQLFISGKKHALRYCANILLAATALLLTLFVLEIVLKAKGFKSGMKIYSQYFTRVDSLYDMQGFDADSNGIFKISGDARKFICDEIREKSFPHELTPYGKDQSHEVYSLAKDFVILKDRKYQSAFKSFIENLKEPFDSTDLEFYHAVKEYADCPINDDGFKSIALKKYHPKRKSVLLLGDSFTWGHSASNKTNCFGDLLLAKGYVVYNTGITGTDPAQYLQVAKTLIPQLEPDYVVVNFYIGNDIKYFERKPLPYMPVFYCTNAGNLISCPEGIYFHSAREAYDHTLSVFYIPAENSGFTRFCAKTVVATLFWRLLAKLNLVHEYSLKYKDYYDEVRAITTTKPYSDIELSEIRELSRQHGGDFLLLAIPMLDGGSFIMPDDFPDLFEDIEYFVPPVNKKHYKLHTDGHFNDLGNVMYADFIDSLINSKMN